MLDPLEFLDPILHILKFVYKIFDVAKTYLHLSMGSVESFLRWMYARHEQLRNLGLLFAALIGLPLLIWRSYSLDRSSRATLMQAENASKSHVADTYTRAIEQLGAVDKEGKPNLELRLGGLYALEKIAKANEDYHPQIMDVLCAYVRMHRPIDSQINKEEFYATYTGEDPIPPPSIDIQTCLAIIGRRQKSFNNDRLNLNEVNLNGASLVEANLSQVDFYGAECIETVFSGADFSGASFYMAELFEADLREENLSGAKNLTCRQIQSANIDRKTIFPDYIKVTWADDDTYTCEMVEESK